MMAKTFTVTKIRPRRSSSSSRPKMMNNVVIPTIITAKRTLIIVIVVTIATVLLRIPFAHPFATATTSSSSSRQRIHHYDNTNHRIQQQQQQVHLSQRRSQQQQQQQQQQQFAEHRLAKSRQSNNRFSVSSLSLLSPSQHSEEDNSNSIQRITQTIRRGGTTDQDSSFLAASAAKDDDDIVPPISLKPRKRSYLEVLTSLLFPNVEQQLPKISASLSSMKVPRNSKTKKVVSSTKYSINNDDSRWKGEKDVTLLQRLFYDYATPVLKTAASNERQLDVYDALPIQLHYKMKNAVPALKEVYEQQKQQSLLEQPNAAAAVDPSWILTKSLFVHQKKMLIKTGILRFFNTAIQAFPALLVARLLRFAESASTGQSKLGDAIGAAGCLVFVLTIKMILENHYFHNLVHMSTQVRGTLMGLLFDKSLRLQNGGVGSTISTATTSSGLMAMSGSDNTNTTTISTNNNNAMTNNELGVGGVLNLMQSDTSLIENAALSIHTSWDGPLQILLYTSLLYRYLGPSVIYGIAVLLVTIPLNSVTLRVLNKLATFENRARDERTKQTSESLRNMKLLKLLSWESIFEKSIQQARANELRLFVLRGFVRALNMAISNAVPAIVLVVTLTAYVKASTRPIVASTIFTAISLFNQLRFPLFFYPMFIDSMANGKNAMKRITSYLQTPEIVPYVQEYPPLNLGNSGNGGSLEMRNGNFVWSSSTGTIATSSTITIPDDPLAITDSNSTEAVAVESATTAIQEAASSALVNVELKVNPGEIVAVVGSVGAGKTALVKGLLGELKPAASSSPELQPVVVRHGEVAYCSQEAWLPKGTIRDAIVFGREYNEDRYLDAIYTAGLDEDIASDDEDDEGTTNYEPYNKANKSKQRKRNGALTHTTDVGEGGSSLSGGQRQRVAIARAIYAANDTAEAKVFLFDDCLAALDAHVGSVVFERLSTKLRKLNAATVFVTNDPNLPRRCDRVILMGSTPSSTDVTGTAISKSSVGSTIIHQGTYDELIACGYDVRRLTSSESEGDEEENLDSEAPTSSSNTPSTIKSHNILSHHNLHTAHNTANETATKEKKHALDPALMKSVARDRKNILVLGGATNATDTDLCYDVWCHADVEGQATMQNCPDYFALQSEPKTTTTVKVGTDDEEEDQPKVEYFEEQAVATNETDSVTQFEISAANDTTISISSNILPENDTTIAPVAQATETNTTTLIAMPSGKKIVSADDSMSSGGVPLSVYASYFKAVGNPLLVAAMFSAFLLSNGAQFFQQYVVAKWTEAGVSTALVSTKYMSSLVKAAVVVSVSLWIRSFLTMLVGVRASTTFHSKMLKSVFVAPMSFFDATPSGQLLSRFGKEIETIDRGVPDSIASVLFCFLQIFLSMGALAGVVTPGMLIPLAFVSVLYVKAMSYFRPAARDMKRVETKTRSPIYTHFGEALRGSETIRSIRGAPATWSNQHRALTDTNLRVFYTVKAFDRWLSTRLETLGNTVVFTTAIASVILTRSGALKAGSAGWGLTQALSITGLLTWAVRCLTDLESNMLSVVRVKELISGIDPVDSKEVNSKKFKIPKELSAAGEALQPLLPQDAPSTALTPQDNSRALVEDGWPWRGKIEFKNVSMKYNPNGPYVLKNVNLVIPAGTTLGVVGRTGSGKSSLLVTLFRLVEIETTPGGAPSSIEIDGIDIRSISMQALRQSLAIIPQDPILFTGTLAYNLDATGQSSTDDMIAALEAASPSLADQFLRSPGADGLNTLITEGGKNLSLGQRQLLCLARALLRKSKILVLDEATSSVDAKTDQEVQETIRREFVNKGVTVITVAHRLDTVLGYDKIAVLGDGEVLEYGKPNELVSKPGGELRRLVLADRRNKEKGNIQRKKLPLSPNEDTMTAASAVAL